MTKVAALLQQRRVINEEIVKKIIDDKTMLKTLADNMAEAATNMHGQGYGHFIDARETFFKTIDRLAEEYSSLQCHK